MINIVNFSGGRSSLRLVHYHENEKRKNPDHEVEYIFADTGAEHPDTYRFLKDVVEHFKIELTCIRVIVHPEMGKGVGYRVVPLSECKHDLIPFKEVCEKYGTPFMPSGKFCTQFLKTRPIEKYCKDKYGNKGKYIKWLGMRVDEPKRIKTTKEQFDMFQESKKADPAMKNVRYLADVCSYDKQDIKDWASQFDFDLTFETDILGNCTFCIERGVNKNALAARLEPGLAEKFIAMVNLDSIPTPETREFPKDVMYRGNMSLENIIEAYKDVSTEDIMRTMRGFKDSGGCGQSCEATFSDDNFDLFEDI